MKITRNNLTQRLVELKPSETLDGIQQTNYLAAFFDHFAAVSGSYTVRLILAQLAGNFSEHRSQHLICRKIGEFLHHDVKQRFRLWYVLCERYSRAQNV